MGSGRTMGTKHRVVESVEATLDEIPRIRVRDKVRSKWKTFSNTRTIEQRRVRYISDLQWLRMRIRITNTFVRDTILSQSNDRSLHIFTHRDTICLGWFVLRNMAFPECPFPHAFFYANALSLVSEILKPGTNYTCRPSCSSNAARVDYSTKDANPSQPIRGKRQRSTKRIRQNYLYKFRIYACYYKLEKYPLRIRKYGDTSE